MKILIVLVLLLNGCAFVKDIAKETAVKIYEQEKETIIKIIDEKVGDIDQKAEEAKERGDYGMYTMWSVLGALGLFGGKKVKDKLKERKIE